MTEIKIAAFPSVVSDQDFCNFTVASDGLYAITITARCKNWIQNILRLFNDDDLAVALDGFHFFELAGKKREFNNVGAWNGNELKNNRKAVLFVIPLQAGEHTITFFTDVSPIVEEVKIVKMAAASPLIFGADFLPQAQNEKLFFDVVLKNVACTDVSVLAETSEGGKLGLKVDGKLAENTDSRRYRIWYWLGNKLNGQPKEHKTDLVANSHFHSLEFKGAGHPVLQKIVFLFTAFSLHRFGKVSLYPDLTTSDFVYLRKEGNNNDGTELAKLKQGDVVEVLEVEATGELISGKTDIWHKVSFQNQMGYILSSFIEIDGQSRDIVVAMIRREAQKQQVDEDLVLALAGGESRYKVYATGGHSTDPKIGKGVFQLTAKLIIDLNDATKPFYSPVSDPFNVAKNIAAGIKYFKWLYQVRYRDSAESVRKAVAAYNAGPGNIPVKGKLNLDGFDPQTKRLVTCVEVNSKRRDWRNILWSVILLMTVSFGLANLNNGGLFNIASASEMVKANADETGSLIFARWKESADTVTLFRLTDGRREIVARFPAAVLNIDKILDTPEDMKAWRSIRIGGLAEVRDAVYFLAATTASCGAQNCSYILYRFDIHQGKLEIVKDNLFGVSIDLLLSPDDKWLATVSSVAGGFCNTGAYVSIIDTEFFASVPIKGFDWPSSTAAYVMSAKWKNNDQFEFSLTQSKCGGLQRGDRDSEYSYTVSEKKLRLLKESFRPESNG